MNSNSTRHKPVLLQEVVSNLAVNEDAKRPPMLLDCTLGGAGHSEALLLKYSNLFLVGLDRDPAAIRRAEERLRPFANRMLLFVDNFANIRSLLGTIEERFAEKTGRTKDPLSFDRILLDLGISSDQLDDPARGFSFQQSGPLDMRLSPTQELMAADIVNEFPREELKRIFLRGGVGSESARLSQAIEKKRPFETTAQLTAVIESVMMTSKRRKNTEQSSKHPATVPFQAIRIAVNDELNSLETFLNTALDLLFPRGRLAVISFHSLEDQIVAKRMRSWARNQPTPLRLPTMQGLAGFGRLLTGKAIQASIDEMKENPRSRSARLRVFEKWDEAGPMDEREERRRKAG